MSSKRTVKGTVSRNPKSTCTPVWATLTSCINSARLRSQRSSGVSLRPSTAGSIGSIPTAYPAPAVTEACRPSQRFVNGQGTRVPRAREPRGAFTRPAAGENVVRDDLALRRGDNGPDLNIRSLAQEDNPHEHGMGRARCRGTGRFHVQLRVLL